MKPVQGANPKVYIPEILRDNTLEWFHTKLHHPGKERMVNTIRQNFTWPKLAQDVATIVATCDGYQRGKVTGQQKYGHIPLPDDHQVEPWDSVHVDLIGLWKISIQFEYEFRALICVYSVIDLPEVIPVYNATLVVVAQTFENDWLSRYPAPMRCIHDNGNKFLGPAFTEMLRRNKIKSVKTTVKNPQSNAFVECMHQSISTIIAIS